MSTTPGPERDRGDRPDGEPEPHRTLAERLTGFGRRHHDDGEPVGGGGSHPAEVSGASTRAAGTGTGTSTTGTPRAGLGGTTAPARNVATGGEDVETDRGPSYTDSTATDSTAERPGEEGPTHGATAAAGGAAGAAGAAALARHHDREHERELDRERTRERDAYTAGRADERAARTNRYARREADDREVVGTDRTDRRAVVERERDRFGGARIGTGFFGWMAATGLAVLMTALTEAIGTAFGAHPATSIPSVTRTTSQTAKTIGWGGTIVLLIIMFLAYLGGGYVAGRMARFHGIRQGFLVWLWGLVVAVVIAAIAHFAGTQYDILGLLNDFPRIPIDVGVTTWGVIALIVVALAGLLGALIGGLWGMSFHRRVDRAGLGR